MRRPAPTGSALTPIDRRRGADEQGFTLIELLMVVVILGVLIAIAVPSYLGFRDRSETAAAKSNVRAAVPSVEAYYGDNSSSYAGMTLVKLKASYDAGIKLDQDPTVLGGGSSYCIQSTVGTPTNVWSRTGPSGVITQAACS